MIRLPSLEAAVAGNWHEFVEFVNARDEDIKYIGSAFRNLGLYTLAAFAPSPIQSKIINFAHPDASEGGYLELYLSHLTAASAVAEIVVLIALNANAPDHPAIPLIKTYLLLDGAVRIVVSMVGSKAPIQSMCNSAGTLALEIPYQGGRLLYRGINAILSEKNPAEF